MTDTSLADQLTARGVAAAEFAAEIPHLEQLNPSISFYAEDDGVRIAAYLRYRHGAPSWAPEVTAVAERLGPPDVQADVAPNTWRLVWNLPGPRVLVLHGSGVKEFIDQPAPTAVSFRIPEAVSA